MFEIDLYDSSKFSLSIPSYPRFPYLQKKIGVLVSGGIDSALLYYLIKNLTKDTTLSVKPYTLLRDDVSNDAAQNVIDFVHDSLGIDREETEFVPIYTEDSNLQVSEGIAYLAKNTNRVLYVGLITTLPEHATGGVPKPIIPPDAERVKFPLRNLNKSHVVDLIEKLEINTLYGLTHSCVYAIKCNVCNRCRERQWAFQQLGLMPE